MNIDSLVTKVLPTMLLAWVILAIVIVSSLATRRFFGLLYKLIKPIIEPSTGQKKAKAELSLEEMARDWYKTFQTRWLSAPNNISMAVKSAWRARERGLAIFAGVFLSSLVITTVLAYAVGLNQAFFAFSLDGNEFDAKVDFQSDPDGDWKGRTNDSALWESLCVEIVEMEEFEDCGLVFGRQGIRVSGFFDSGFTTPQPLNVEIATGASSGWDNVSWDFPEAVENGPPINSGRIIRFYGDGIWDGELGERHAKSVIYGAWPSSGADAEANRSVVLPSKIASIAGVEVNETIDSLTFSYVLGTYEGADIDIGYSECQTQTVLATFEDSPPVLYCKNFMTVTNLTISAIYEEGDFGNPTLLFHPVIVSDSVLTEQEKTTLMQNDHGYLGVALDRTQIPTSSTRAATIWLRDIGQDLESVRTEVSTLDPATGEPTGGTESVLLPREFVIGEGAGAVALSIEYNDIVSGTITFLNIFLGIIQVFDYILVIPIVALSFVVLLYGLVLSLEQRRREVAIHRVIGGTEATLSRMMVLEIYAIGTIAWALGFALASGAVEVVLRAVGFLRFTDEGDISVDPVLSFFSTFAVAMLTIGSAYVYGRKRTNDFLNIEIDEGVRKVSTARTPNYILHWAVFVLGIISYVESWIQSNGGFLFWGSGGIITNFILNAILLLLGPFFLWIGGALVLSRIGASGPQILNRLVGWSPAISDIRRGLSGSGSSQSVSRLSLIMLLTLSIVTLAAVQGHTGTMVDERTTSAQNGADLQVQFDSELSESQAMSIVMQSIETVGDSAINDVDSLASVSYLFPGVLDRDNGGLYSTWVLFDGHEETLIWDEQAIPGDDESDISRDWRQGAYTAGDGARDALDRPSTGSPLNISIANFEYEFGIPSIVASNVSVKVNYAGNHNWIPGFSSAESENSIIIGESTYLALLGSPTDFAHSSDRWFFELCNEQADDCKSALEAVSADLRSKAAVISAQDWSSAHESNERNGGLVFGTPGLLSMMFVIAALASVSSAFVFLSLVLSQRKRELAILQAIGASPNQVVRLVLFEIMSILLVSMVLGVTLGLAVSESFNGFFSVFGFIFQLFLGQSAPIDRDLIWPWFELVIVNGLVLAAVVISLLFTTRRALESDLATVLKGE
tara:strand:+ start:8558 stop:11959 length:3402 start_codon:yes stop_codon:yes gene_type:complete